MRTNYQQTKIACYLGIITQAISANFAPLLFLTFRQEFGLSLGQVALIPTVFFFTQLLVDLISAKYVDRIGYRPSIIASEAFSVAGLAGLAFLPALFSDPFVGILLCVILYAVGSGLIEVLVSPIIEACPFENKEGTMSLLHSFYCWGSVAVILLSTLFFYVFGIRYWRVLALLWTLIPLINICNFAVCPIEHIVEADESMSILQLVKMPFFWLLVLLMICAGASELSMAQWASAFTESALHVSKTAGDLAGPCLFAVLMGTSRVLYGKYSEKVDLLRFMQGSGVLCVICYLLASLSPLPVFGLIGCALCGFSVGVMWPGTISISAKKCPKGGTALFALLALAGDLGGSLGPSFVGTVSDMAGENLQMGLLAAMVFPIALIVGLFFLKRNWPAGKRS
ncbi:MAG: MFS transporter [Clostridia bacterium]|nr:MFS transporter [Clostridia bacterium]MBR4444220.1 MFS transporter [Clostridia bacterium]